MSTKKRNYLKYDTLDDIINIVYFRKEKMYVKIIEKIYLILAIVGAFFTITSCTRLVSIQIDLEETNYEVRLGQKS